MGSQLCHYKSDVKGRALCSGNAVRLIHTRIWLNGRLNNVLDLSFIHQWPLQRQLGLCKMTWEFLHYFLSFSRSRAHRKPQRVRQVSRYVYQTRNATVQVVIREQMPLHDHFLSESLDQFIRSRGFYSLHSLGVTLPTGEKPHAMLSCVNTCKRIKPKIINSEIKETF